MENEMIYDPSMSDNAIPVIRAADPELEALLDEEERISREARMPPQTRGGGLKFTRHFQHNGREADIEVQELREGNSPHRAPLRQVMLRVKIIEETTVTEMREFDDCFGTSGEIVEVVRERIPMGKTIEIPFTPQEWQQFLRGAELFGQGGGY